MTTKKPIKKNARTPKNNVSAPIKKAETAVAKPAQKTKADTVENQKGKNNFFTKIFTGAKSAGGFTATARSWGESLPKSMAAASRKIADGGRRLFDKAKRSQTSSARPALRKRTA